jgi:hypothetical protein
MGTWQTVQFSLCIDDTCQISQCSVNRVIFGHCVMVLLRMLEYFIIQGEYSISLLAGESLVPHCQVCDLYFPHLTFLEVRIQSILLSFDRIS